ncbi:Gx transporter family protein [Treponema parvum]|uniref:Gx transporter family protein n=1 Tax=Treponema parvum TaxID=138851 RepID=A0A975IBG9_9SPIR|nr:Gx transporter family protein [Treponema parvum]QTQ10767.1 Gx transporter family protein [Treponema parvum]QTQ15037.1 Gx transporter family protein [Treponema parvum]
MQTDTAYNSRDDKVRLISFFTALCMFLSAVEYAIPKPLPFLRLGLTNLPVLLSLSVLKKRDVLLLILLKILAQGFVSGTLFSYIFLFSAAGSFASGITMLALYTVLKKSKYISVIGLSLAGSLANNLSQIALARLIIFGKNTRFIAPVLLASGLVTGVLIGIFAEFFTSKSKWFSLIRGRYEAS